MKISHDVSQSGMKRTLKNIYSGSRTLYKETAQNALRAGANNLCIDQNDDEKILTFSNDGRVLTDSDWTNLFFTAESGWDESVAAEHNAFGIGISMMLYVAREVRIHSGYALAEIDTAIFRTGCPVELQDTDQYCEGVIFELKLNDEFKLSNFDDLEKCFKAFPVAVYFNGVKIVPTMCLGNTSYHWVSFTYGTVGIPVERLSALDSVRYEFFVKGLPISGATIGSLGTRIPVHLESSKIELRVPDRESIVDAPDDLKQSLTDSVNATIGYLLERKADKVGWPTVFEQNFRMICSRLPKLLSRRDSPVRTRDIFNLTSEVAEMDEGVSLIDAFGDHYGSFDSFIDAIKLPKFAFSIDNPCCIDESDHLPFVAYLYHAGHTIVDGLPRSHWFNERVVEVSADVEGADDEGLHRWLEVEPENASECFSIQAGCESFNIAFCDSLKLVPNLVSLPGGDDIQLDDMVLTEGCFYLDGVIYLIGGSEVSGSLFDMITNYSKEDDYFARDEDYTERMLNQLNRSVRALRNQSPALLIEEIINSHLDEWAHYADDLGKAPISFRIEKSDSGRPKLVAA